MLKKYSYLIISLCILPLLIIQALWTRKKTISLPEPQGNRKEIVGVANKSLSILILGDSAAAGVGVQQQDQALSGQLVKHLKKDYVVDWLLFAKTGDRTLDTFKKLNVKEIDFEKQFDYILISLGVNDVTSLITINQWLNNCDSLIKLLKKKFNPKKIYWSELPPMGNFTALPLPLRWVIGQRRDVLAKELSAWIDTQSDVVVLRFPDVFPSIKKDVSDWIASDGYHPGEKVYSLWGKIAAERVIEDNQKLSNNS